MKRTSRIRMLRARLRRVAGYVPLRLPGVLLVAAALGALWFSRSRADYLLFPASLAALGLVAICLVFSLAGALALWRSVRRLPAGLPDQIETTCTVRTVFRFRRMVAWPLVEPRMEWVEPAGVAVELQPAGAWLEEAVTAVERGRHARIVRRFAVEDIFGLTGIAFRVAYEHPLRIVPARCAEGPEVAAGHASGDAFSHASGRQEGDLVEMRRYGAGDPMRHILWKTFARTRRLLVRMPERAITPQPSTSAFMVAGDGDEASAATARLYVEAGLLGTDFVFGADGASSTTDKPDQAVEQIIDSIYARGDGGKGLESFRRSVDPTRLGRCVLFVPPRDGAWCDRVKAFAHALPVPATVIIGIDGPVLEQRRRRIARWLLRSAAGSRTHGELARVRITLESAGLHVKVVHRETGQLL